MTTANILGPLSTIHDLQAQLLESVPEVDASRQYHPELASMAWYLGRSVYLETYWLREVLDGDRDLTQRVEKLFTPGALPLAEQCATLPPREHLLNWARQIRDDHLMRLANPGQLPNSPLLTDDRLAWFLLQEQAKLYERMVMVMAQRGLTQDTDDYRVREALMPEQPRFDAVEVDKGHYRIGARGEPAAYDNELPPQAVELSAYRIARQPVSNAEYLAFMQDGGYSNDALWDDHGLVWRNAHASGRPEGWRQDVDGHWYEVSMNGPADLVANQPVSGICRHEALAFARWTDTLGGDLKGAVLQHEYQWEVATRTGVIDLLGRVWEWTSNDFHAYPAFTPFPDELTSAAYFSGGYAVLRGASLHTQRILRRACFREWILPRQRFHFSGARLVFPPSPDLHFG